VVIDVHSCDVGYFRVMSGISECGQCANKPGRLLCRWLITIQHQHST